MLSYRYYSRPGFTLLEGIIALTVIIVGLVAGITLAVVNIGSAQNNERRIVAANLAREGIEAMRNSRDSNWLKVDLNKSYVSDAGGGQQLYAWDSFLADEGSWSSAGNKVLAVQYVPPAGLAQPAYTFFAITSASSCPSGNYLQCCINAGGNECQVNYDAATSLYGTASGAATGYQRIITIQDICYDDPNNTESVQAVSNGCATDRVGVVVTSQVRYPVGRSTQDVIARERLYNWR